MEVSGAKSRPMRIWKFLCFGVEIFKSNLSNRYDLVLAERSTSYGFFSLFVRARKRIVAQQGITDIWPNAGIAKIYKGLLQKIVYQRVDLIHAWGEAMVPGMLGSKADPARIMVLPKGIDLDVYHFGKEKEENLAIVTRSFTSVYNHIDILEALAILKRDGVNIRCIMVGDGDMAELLQQKTEDLGIPDRVEFTGRIPNSHLPEYLQKASMYLSVPSTEGVSASLFEAMASGCFPIVTDLPGTRAFITHGVNGMLIPVNDPGKLAEGIKEYMAQTGKYRSEVMENRRYIEDQVDQSKNMQLIWERYVQLFRS